MFKFKYTKININHPEERNKYIQYRISRIEKPSTINPTFYLSLHHYEDIVTSGHVANMASKNHRQSSQLFVNSYIFKEVSSFRVTRRTPRRKTIDNRSNFLGVATPLRSLVTSGHVTDMASKNHPQLSQLLGNSYIFTEVSSLLDHVVDTVRHVADNVGHAAATSFCSVRDTLWSVKS